MAEETTTVDQSVTNAPVDNSAPTAQEIPLGGQPKRNFVQPEEAAQAQVSAKDTAKAQYDAIIKALDKALDSVKDSKAEAAMTLRNHCQVWKLTAETLRDAI